MKNLYNNNLFFAFVGSRKLEKRRRHLFRIQRQKNFDEQFYNGFAILKKS